MGMCFFKIEQGTHYNTLGLYASHTLGRRTGRPVYGCTGYDDPENWLDKPCCDCGEMIWYNKSLPILARRYPFVTCVTCTKVVRVTSLEQLSLAEFSGE